MSLVSCDLSELFKLRGLVKCQFSGKNISSHAAGSMTYFVGGKVISRTVSFPQIPGLMVLGSACVNPSEACHVPATATRQGGRTDTQISPILFVVLMPYREWCFSKAMEDGGVWSHLNLNPGTATSKKYDPGQAT